MAQKESCSFMKKYHGISPKKSTKSKGEGKVRNLLPWMTNKIENGGKNKKTSTKDHQRWQQRWQRRRTTTEEVWVSWLETRPSSFKPRLTFFWCTQAKTPSKKKEKKVKFFTPKAWLLHITHERKRLGKGVPLQAPRVDHGREKVELWRAVQGVATVHLGASCEEARKKKGEQC